MNNPFENYTNKSREYIANANKLATKMGNPEVTEIHLIYSLIEDENSIVSQVLKRIKMKNNEFNYDGYKGDVTRNLNSLPSQSGNVKLRDSHMMLKIMYNSEDEAKSMEDTMVSVEHLFLAFLKEKTTLLDDTNKKFAINYKSFKKELLVFRDGKNVTSDNPEETSNVLELFGRDLTELAKLGKIDPVIGRDMEIRNTERILSRRKKNNPILIGHPGVGKTAIIEGLAQRIVNKDVPEPLLGKTIFELDMGALVAGAKVQGQFEERLKNVLKEVEKSKGQIIMFIDEIHLIVGAGRNSGAMDASNIMKPMLARGDIKVIGATTFNEYREFIEKDGALERRFQKVIIEEPSILDTISILRGIKDKYEIHHGISIADSAVIACAELSDRYITNRFLPDKAIDLMDEACAAVRTEIDTMPEYLDETRRKILQMQIEITTLKNDEVDNNSEKLLSLEKELANMNDKYNEELLKWQEDKTNINKIKNIKSEIDDIKKQIEQAERDYDFEKLSELRYGILPELTEKLEKANKDNAETLKEVVINDDVAEVISNWTNIPVAKLSESEASKILSLPDTLHETVVGQDEAIKKISAAIVRARSGMKDITKPIGSFLFLGTSGSGKTVTAKALAAAMFDSSDNIIRFDMSEYMEKYSISRLIGAAPGYVGYEEGGQLTEAVRQKPYSVILFDEIEKGHPDVFNLLLQILDDGRLTDSQGRTVDFKNTIIIMTSNLGSDMILSNMRELNIEEITEEFTTIIKPQIDVVLKSHFKPEFLNRIDNTVIFSPLNQEEMFRIIDLQIDEINNRLSDRRIKISLTDTAKKTILDNSYEPEMGARPIKRFLQDTIETYVGEMILSGEVLNGETIEVDADEQGFII